MRLKITSLPVVKIWRVEIIKLNWKRWFSYRANAATKIIWIVIGIVVGFYVWSAFHSGANVLAYVILTTAMMQFMYDSVIEHVLEGYRSGNIIFDILRPTKLEKLSFWKWVGGAISDPITLGMVFLAIAFSFNILFVISLALAIYIRYLIGFVTASLTYEMYYSWAPSSILRALTYATGGGIPYFLMPEIVQKILWFNPLFYAMAAPWVAVENPSVILFQIAFVGLFYVIAQFTGRRMLTKFTTVGV